MAWYYPLFIKRLIVKKEEHISYLKSHGFTVIENFLSNETTSHYKNLIKSYFSNGKNRCLGYKDKTSTLKPDGINEPHFEDMKNIFTNKRLLDVIRNITDNKLRNDHHFDVHLNMPGAKGWHTDVQNIYSDGGKNLTKDQGGVWKNTYGVYRIAIFLQDHFNNKGGFSVIPASHLVEENEHKIFNEVNKNLFEDEYYIPSKAGDCILFDARLLHKGNHYDGDRYSIFTGIGFDNKLSKEHARGSIDRQTRQNLQPKYVMQNYLKHTLDKSNIKYDY